MRAPTSSGAQVLLADLVAAFARMRVCAVLPHSGEGSYVDDAKRALDSLLTLPTGYSLTWNGQYENRIRVRERLKIIIPITILLIFVLLYANTGSTAKASIIMVAVPFALIGTVWYLWILDYHISIAVWVGMIALMRLLELLVYPPIYAIWKWHFEMKKGTVDVSTLPMPELKEH